MGTRKSLLKRAVLGRRLATFFMTEGWQILREEKDRSRGTSGEHKRSGKRRSFIETSGEKLQIRPQKKRALHPIWRKKVGEKKGR